MWDDMFYFFRRRTRNLSTERQVFDLERLNEHKFSAINLKAGELN